MFSLTKRVCPRRFGFFGLKHSVKSHVTQRDTDGLRDESAKTQAGFHEKILRLELNTGSSMIRPIPKPERMDCAVEQSISICLKESGGAFIGDI